MRPRRSRRHHDDTTQAAAFQAPVEVSLASATIAVSISKCEFHAVVEDIADKRARSGYRSHQ